MSSPTPLDASRPPLHRSLVCAGSTLLQRQGEREKCNVTRRRGLSRNRRYALRLKLKPDTVVLASERATGRYRGTISSSLPSGS